MSGSRGRGELGETLVEVLVAISILGLAGVAIMAGLGLAVKSSDIGRKQATGGSYVRSYAEKIELWVAQNGLAPCGAPAPYAADTVGFAHSDTDPSTLPKGYNATAVVKGSWTASGWGACTDIGVQKVALNVATSDGRASESLNVVLRKPCNGSLPNPC